MKKNPEAFTAFMLDEETLSKILSVTEPEKLHEMAAEALKAGLIKRSGTFLDAGPNYYSLIFSMAAFIQARAAYFEAKANARPHAVGKMV